jgi:hypothetical protein
LAAIFGGQTRVSCLTREEECLLQTALAVVVVKRRLTSKEDTCASSPAQKPKRPRFENLESFFSNPSKRLLTKPYPEHVANLFYAAKALNTANNVPWQGTASHLAHQLQLWLLRNDNNDVHLFLKKQLRTPDSLPILHGILEQAFSSELKCMIFELLIHDLHNVYNDELSSEDIDVLTVGWMRLLQTSLLVCSDADTKHNMLQILQQVFQELLVPLDSSSVIQTYWRLSMTCRASHTNTKQMLDPGAKLLLRLGLYRLLYLQQEGNEESMIDQGFSQEQQQR